MKCESCKQNEATFFYEETINGIQKSVKLCADCAAKMQEGQHLSFPSFTGFHGNLLEGLFGLSTSPVAVEPQKACPECKATWNDLVKAGKAFCPHCYITFGKELEPSLRSLHGSNVTHTGRAPAGRRAQWERRDQLASLKKQLSDAIQSEQFEKAAQLRDQIRALEKE